MNANEVSGVGSSLNWDPLLLSLHISGDVILYISYLIISLAIGIYSYRKKSEYKIAGYFLAGFIFLYSLSHLGNVITIWYPYHLVAGAFKAAIGIIIFIAAVVAFPLMYRFMDHKTAREYNEHIKDLKEKQLKLTRLLQDQIENSRLLGKELQHRTQKILAVVQGISKETARSTSDIPSYLNHFNSRVSGMVHSQDVLKANHWRGASLKDVVHAQLEDFPSIGDCKLEGPDVFLNTDAVEHISMAVHELASNTVKHGINGHKPKCMMTWYSLNKQNGKSLRINWHEQHPKDAKKLKVPRPTHKGFGSVVLEYIVPTSVNGFSDLHFESNGDVTWQLEAPQKSMCIANVH